MNKVKIFITLLLSVNLLHGQNNTQSPYSKLGLGDFQTTGFGSNSALGGLGYALYPNDQTNLLNPASLAHMDSMLSMLNVGLKGQYTNLKNSQASDVRRTANLTNFSYGMGISDRFGLAIGITPYTNVGYSIITEQQVNGSNEKYNVLLEGSGGISTAFVSGGYKLTKNIAIGLNVGLYFGPKNEIQTYLYNNEYDIDITTQVADKYLGWIFDLGYQQRIPINKNHTLSFGAVANLPSKLSQTQEKSVILYYGSEESADSLSSESEKVADVSFPVNIGAGLAYNYREKLTINVDYSIKRWSKASVSDAFSNLSNNHILAFGIEYLPRNKILMKHKIKYRIGANMQSGYYELNGRNLNSFSLTAGVGFHLGKNVFNVYGTNNWRGFTNTNYIEENTIQFGVNMSFGDLWFQKRKYN